MARKLKNVHPGEVLREEFLEPMEISQYRLAKDIDVPATRIAEICSERRGISADTALRLAKYFGTSAKFWLGMQQDYELEQAQREKGREHQMIEPRKGATP